MEYRSFGNLGWQVSVVGFGGWAIGGDMWGPQDDGASLAALHRALDLGVNFIDTAQGYGKGHSETLIGRVLRERGGDDIYVATKVPPVPGATWPPPPEARSADYFPAAYIIEQCEGSLRRLQREALDVYQFHTWAAGFNVDDEWHEAMERLREQGKIRAVGVSVPDTTPENVIGALARGRVDAVQVIYNLFDQVPQWNLFPACERLGIGVIVGVPFDESALTGKLRRDTTFPEGDVRAHYFRGNNLAAVVARVEEIRAYQEAHHPDMSMAEFALRFAISHEAVSTVIPGIRNPRQAEMNTAVADGRRLDPAEVADLRRFLWRRDFWHEEVPADA